MLGFTPTEITVIGTIVVLLFVTRLPGVVRSMARSIDESKMGGMGDNRYRTPQEMEEKRTQPLWLAPALAILGGLLGLIVERTVMGRWGYSGLLAGTFVAVAMLITGLIARR